MTVVRADGWDVRRWTCTSSGTNFSNTTRGMRVQGREVWDDIGTAPSNGVFLFSFFPFFFFFFFYDCGTHAHSREGGGGGQTNPGTMTTTYAFLSPSH